MKTLIVMCGVMCSGKSTFVKAHGLENNVVCPDSIRIQVAGTTYDENGNYAIRYDNDCEKVVWDMAKNMVRTRLEKGNLTVLDAMNVSIKNVRPFLQIAKDTLSRVFVVDMMSENSFEDCLERNEARTFNKIPVDAMYRAYEQYKTLEWSRSVQVIKPSDFEKVVYRKPVEVEHDYVAVFGDIHGCYDVMMEALDSLPENTLKVFVGDYCDRGDKSSKVLQWCLEHKEDEDKIFIEGNHEAHLRNYAKGIPATPAFEESTRRDLETTGVPRKEVRRFLSRLREMFYFTIGGHTVVATHGGLSTMNKNLVFVPSYEMIHGVGKYGDMNVVAQTWDTLCDGVIQVHGHRNIYEANIQESKYSYNLEGKIEFGGDLRMVIFGKDGSIETRKFRNKYLMNQKYDKTSVADFVEALRNNRLIREKQFGDISSFNFTKQAFFSGIWDNMSQKARGLYINTKTNEVVARGFDKFFNIGERPHTDIDDLARDFQYPVEVYLKENGFLGLVGYDSASDTLIITSKSNLEGTYAGYVKDNLLAKVGANGIDKIKKYVKDNKCTLALEVCDKINDPHIIEYPDSDVYLLAIINNDIIYRDKDYSVVVDVAKELGLNYKKKVATLLTQNDFYQFIAKDFGKNIEGFVFEDLTGYMVKYKTPYYNYWKHKRSIVQCKKPNLVDDSDTLFYDWFLQSDFDKETDIITLRNAYLKEKAGS